MAQVVAEETLESVDIRDATIVLSHENETNNWLYVSAQVILGSDDNPIAGGEPYLIDLYLDGIRMHPSTPMSVPAAESPIIVQSRPIAFRPGQTLAVKVTGAPSDEEVGMVVMLLDVTPVTRPVYESDGTVIVDHNYGGADNLTYTDADEVGIDNGVVRAYLEEHYDDNLLGSDYLAGDSRTNSLGRWIRPIALDPGDYVFVFFKQGAYQPTERRITVA